MFCSAESASARTRRTSGTRCRRFDTVQQDGQLGNIQFCSKLLRGRARAGALPAVSWVVPSQTDSEHPPGLVTAGQTYVTDLVNAIMRSPDWKSTAIFVSWDDWGGFYDHVVPPVVNARGLRPARAGPRDQPVRAEGLHRPSDAELRRVPQVHRGRLPRRPAARSEHRRPSRTRGRTSSRTSAFSATSRGTSTSAQKPPEAAHPAAPPAVFLERASSWSAAATVAAWRRRWQKETRSNSRSSRSRSAGTASPASADSSSSCGAGCRATAFAQR